MTKRASTKTSKDLFVPAQSNPNFQRIAKEKIKASAKENALKDKLGRRHQKLT